MTSESINYNLSEIQKNAEILDSEALHLYLIQKIESGEYDTCLEALTAYVEENDIDIESQAVMKKYISPSLMGILYKEAQDKSLLVDQGLPVSVDEFF